MITNLYVKECAYLEYNNHKSVMDSFIKFIEENLYHEHISPIDYKERIYTYLDNICDFQGLEQDFSPPITESRGKLCGYAFEKGDLVYRCKDCGRDPTCVLCSNCFRYEEHQNHEIFYNITSNTGGCCDCGDSEAWKTQLQCDVHHPSGSHNTINKDINPIHTKQLLEAYDCGSEKHVIAKDLLDIINILFLSFINPDDPFITRFQYDNTTDSFSDSFKYQVTLYNDEVHSFEAVIDILKEAIDCTNDQARQYAERVDTFGLAIVYQHNSYIECQRVSNIISSIGLKSLIMTRWQSCLQFASFECLCWIVAKCSTIVWMQFVFSSELLNNSRISLYIKNEHLLWKEARTTLKQFLMNTMLKFYYFKYQLSVIFSSLYKNILHEFLHNDREPDMSIIFFTVQLYTVPSIVKSLVKDSLLVQLLSSILEEFTYQDSKIQLDKDFVLYRRYFHPFQDIRYILDGSSYSDLGDSDKITMKKMFQFMAFFENMDMNYRESIDHVEFESDTWIHAFNISIQLSRILKDFATFCNASYEDIQSSIEHLFSNNPSMHIDNSPVSIINGSFSFHHPQCWMISSLLRNLAVWNPTAFSTCLNSYEYDIVSILERLSIIVLELYVYCSQVRSGLWVRNGSSIRNQILNYTNIQLIDDFYIQDMFLLGCYIWIFEPYPEKFSMNIIEHVFGWIDMLNGSISESLDKDDEPRLLSGYMNDFLFLLITITSDDLVEGECYNLYQLIEHSVNHVLFLGPCSYSELKKKISSRFAEHSDIIEEILNKNPESKRQSSISEGSNTIVYRKSDHTGIDMYHIYYNVSNRQTCYQELKRHKNINGFLPDIKNINPRVKVLSHSKELIEYMIYILVWQLSNTFDFWIVHSCCYLLYRMYHANSDIVISNCNVYYQILGRNCSMISILQQVKDSFEECQETIRIILKLLMNEEQSHDQPAIDRKHEAALRRQRIMENMAKMQQEFLSKHEDSDEYEHNIDDNICAICHESCNSNSSVVGFMARIFNEGYQRLLDPLMTRNSYSDSTIVFQYDDTLLNGWRIQDGIHSTICRHLFHFSCYESSIRQSSSRCPLCRKRANCFLPTIVDNRHDISFDSVDTRALIISSLVHPIYETHYLNRGVKKKTFNPRNDISLIDLVELRDNLLPDKVDLVNAWRSLCPLTDDDATSTYFSQVNRMIEILVNQVDRNHPTLDGIAVPNYMYHEIFGFVCNLVSNHVATMEISNRQNHNLDIVNMMTQASDILSFDDNDSSMHQLKSLIHSARLVCLHLRSTCADFHMDRQLMDTLKMIIGKFPGCTKNHRSKLLKQSNLTILCRFVILFCFNTYKEEMFDNLIAWLFIKLWTCSKSVNIYRKSVKMERNDNPIFNRLYSTFIPLLGNTFEYEPKTTVISLAYLTFPFLKQAFIIKQMLYPGTILGNNNILIEEYYMLLDCFGIGNINEYSRQIFHYSWISSNQDISQELEWPLPYDFIPLPYRYDELMLETLKKPCKKCQRIPSEPAICLLCGKLCCSQAFCCMERSMGECNIHTLTRCGKTVGVFFIIQRCGLLMLSGHAGSVQGGPYVDSRNETDYGFRRGNPMYLDIDMMRYLRKSWLTHGISDIIDTTQEQRDIGLLFQERMFLFM